MGIYILILYRAFSEPLLIDETAIKLSVGQRGNSERKYYWKICILIELKWREQNKFGRLWRKELDVIQRWRLLNLGIRGALLLGRWRITKFNRFQLTWLLIKFLII